MLSCVVKCALFSWKFIPGLKEIYKENKSRAKYSVCLLYRVFLYNYINN